MTMKGNQSQQDEIQLKTENTAEQNLVAKKG